jgi:hypothetical protein
VTVDEGSFVTQINIDNTTVGLNRPVDYVISDGNTLHDITVTRNITIEDNVPPYAELIGSNNIRVPLNSVWEDVDPGLTNFDTGSSLVSVTGFSNTVTDAQFVYYNLTDGVNSNSILRVVTCTLPSGTVNTAVSTTLERFDTYVEPDEAIIVTDGYLARIDTSNVDNTATHGTQQVIVYDLGDDVNNTLVTRTITIQDTTAPTGTVNTAVSSTLERFGTYVEPDEAIINMDQSTYVARIDTSNVDSTAPHGTQQVIVYDLGDGVNSNLLLTRTITIQDTTTPTGTVNTAVSSTLERFGTYVEPDEAIINMDQSTYVARIDTSNVDSTAPHGTQQVIVYDLGDGVNSNLLLTRTITIQDTVAPVITITNDTITGNTLERFDVYSDAGASVDPGSVLTTDLSQVQNTAVGSFNVVYTANDGNTTSTAIRTVTVVDTTPPLITLNGDNPYYVERFSNFVDPFAYADAGSTMLPADLSNVDTSLPYGDSFDVVYSAVDISGSNTAIRTVILDGEQAKIQASDKQASDFFGFSVSISEDGNTAIVAASHDDTTSGYNNAGGAYIFTRSGTTWTQQAKIQASDGRSMEYFGWSIAISGDGNTAIVGAFGANSAYIFTRSGTSWSEQQKIQAASDFFGRSVSMSDDGNTAIVGAPYDDTGVTNAGSAYIFTRSGTTWTQQQKIQASDKQADDYFGTSVSISSDGNTAIVGAYGEDTGATSAGAAYIFTWSGTTWTQQQKIQASDKQASDFFGFSVSISEDGNTAIVGAYGEDTGGSDAGAAYIFTRSGTSWSEQQKIQASDKQASDQFGRSVSISDDGNTAIVGAYLEDTGATEEDTGVTDAGSAYIFTRSGTTWTQQRKIQASDKQAYDRFGWSVAISGDGETTIVGATHEDTVGAPTGASDTGAAYIYRYNF